MPERARIAQQMKQAVEGGAWHGPSVLEILSEVDAVTAAARPVEDAHTIWEIVLHLVGTQTLLLHWIDGREKRLTPEEDWPSMPEPADEEAWKRTIEQFTANDVRIRAHVERFVGRLLDEPIIDGGSSAYNNFHGYVQHNLYHAGQIRLLRKAAPRAS